MNTFNFFKQLMRSVFRSPFMYRHCGLDSQSNPCTAIRLGMIAAILMISLTGCDEIDPNAIAFQSFTFSGQKGTSKIDAKKRTVDAVAENTVNLGAITPNFKLSPTGAEATVNGEPQISGSTTQSFWEPVKYLLTTPEGESAEWTVSITTPDGGGGGGGTKVTLKSATIYYVHGDGEPFAYVCFDDYGKRIRFQPLERDGKTALIFICDKVKGVNYGWDEENKWSNPILSAVACTEGMQFVTDLLAPTYEMAVSLMQGTKKKATIAGKSCDVYSLSGLETSIWGGIVILKLAGGGDVQFVAATAREGCPNNAFTQTVDIAW